MAKDSIFDDDYYIFTRCCPYFYYLIISCNNNAMERFNGKITQQHVFIGVRNTGGDAARIKRYITLDQCYCCLVHQLVYGMIGAARGLVFGRFAL